MGTTPLFDDERKREWLRKNVESADIMGKRRELFAYILLYYSSLKMFTC